MAEVEVQVDQRRAFAHRPMGDVYAVARPGVLDAWLHSGKNSRCGAAVQGLAGLRAILLRQPDRFPATVTEKLLAYALGRGVEIYDRPEVRRIVRDAAAHDHRWSSIILGVVKSTPFLMRRSES